MVDEILQGRCVKCCMQVEIMEPIFTKTSRGVNIAKGYCETCKTKVCRMLPKNFEVVKV